ncbi:hypothetical protein HPB51_003286 [Rhipicephalus microplus]|uniref:Uncharacterized protein n=1 Tax=Rhipicephalus microplus TaxID=6941 RepID=A0A9J6EWN6_RHIMP|nr:hypothetical protein HPB51_003286 [Rhipicephalus microplus]
MNAQRPYSLFHGTAICDEMSLSEKSANAEWPVSPEEQHRKFGHMNCKSLPAPSAGCAAASLSAFCRGGRRREKSRGVAAVPCSVVAGASSGCRWSSLGPPVYHNGDLDGVVAYRSQRAAGYRPLSGGDTMAVVGARSGRPVIAFTGATAAAPQQAILTAAQPFYHPPVTVQDIQPDRPIGYGAFGVVCPRAAGHAPAAGAGARCRDANISSLADPQEDAVLPGFAKPPLKQTESSVGSSRAPIGTARRGRYDSELTHFVSGLHLLLAADDLADFVTNARVERPCDGVCASGADTAQRFHGRRWRSSCRPAVRRRERSPAGFLSFAWTGSPHARRSFCVRATLRRPAILFGGLN